MRGNRQKDCRMDGRRKLQTKYSKKVWAAEPLQSTKIDPSWNLHLHALEPVAPTGDTDPAVTRKGKSALKFSTWGGKGGGGPEVS
jgi:hypothetical protein